MNVWIPSESDPEAVLEELAEEEGEIKEGRAED